MAIGEAGKPTPHLESKPELHRVRGLGHRFTSWRERRGLGCTQHVKDDNGHGGGSSGGAMVNHGSQLRLGFRFVREREA